MSNVNHILLLIHRQAKHDFFAYFNRVLAEGLEEKGVQVTIADFSEDPEEWKPIAAQIIRKAYDAVLVLNSWGEQNLNLDSGENLFDKAGVPFFHWIVDHPAEHSGHLHTACRNYHVICIDRDHIAFLEKYYPDVASADFLPLPVADEGKAGENFEQFSERGMDVVFAGNCPDTAHMEGLFQKCQEDRREFLFFLAEYLLKNRDKSYETALYEILKEVFGEEPEPQLFCEYVDLTLPVIPYIRARVREETVREVINSNVHLHLYGAGWERFRTEIKNGNTEIKGVAAFQDLPEIYRNTKIVLNVMPWFRNGIHDRIAAGIYAGAVVATDHSIYLDEIAADPGAQNGLMFYDIQNTAQLPSLLENALGRPEALFETTCNGRTLAEKYLSVAKIVDGLIEIIQKQSVIQR